MSEQPITWLTQEAHDRLESELADREGPLRHEIKKRIEAAREEGDLKENGGYHAAKDEQGKNEARIRQLRQMLDHAQIGSPPSEDGQAAHGTVISVELLNSGRTMTFLLGSREEAAHTDVDVISPSSPMGAAVDGARVGDEVTYTTPAGKDVTARITNVAPYVG